MAVLILTPQNDTFASEKYFELFNCMFWWRGVTFHPFICHTPHFYYIIHARLRSTRTLNATHPRSKINHPYLHKQLQATSQKPKAKTTPSKHKKQTTSRLRRAAIAALESQGLPRETRPHPLRRPGRSVPQETPCSAAAARSGTTSAARRRHTPARCCTTPIRRSAMAGHRSRFEGSASGREWCPEGSSCDLCAAVIGRTCTCVGRKRAAAKVPRQRRFCFVLSYIEVGSWALYILRA